MTRLRLPLALALALAGALALAAAGLASAGRAAPPTPREFLGEVAGLLGTDRSEAFLRLFSPDMPHYAEFRERVSQMMAQCEVSSGIDVLEEKAEGDTVEFSVDWELALNSRAPEAMRESRSVRMRIALERWGKSWRVKSLSTLELFGPIRGR